MTDYSELKRLAEAATIGDKPASTPIAELIGAQDAFLAECRPKKVLGLIAENEALSLKHAEAGRLYLELAAERDQLKAENELLRKDAERIDWLDGRSRPVVEGQCMGNPEGELAGYDWGVFGQCATVREAIDDAMTKGDHS